MPLIDRKSETEVIRGYYPEAVELILDRLGDTLHKYHEERHKGRFPIETLRERVHDVLACAEPTTVITFDKITEQIHSYTVIYDTFDIHHGSIPTIGWTITDGVDVAQHHRRVIDVIKDSGATHYVRAKHLGDGSYRVIYKEIQ